MITIRKAVIGDEQALFGMAKQFEPAIYKLNESDFLETFRDLLSRDNMYLAVAIDQSEIIGYLLAVFVQLSMLKSLALKKWGRIVILVFLQIPFLLSSALLKNGQKTMAVRWLKSAHPLAALAYLIRSGTRRKASIIGSC